MRILHITLAILILISGNGISIYKHVCSTLGTTVGLFTQGDHCCSRKRKCNHPEPVKESSGSNIKNSACCKSEFQYLKANILADDISFIQKIELSKLFSPFVLIEISSNYLFYNISKTFFSLYHGPPVPIDILSLIQAFRC